MSFIKKIIAFVFVLTAIPSLVVRAEIISNEHKTNLIPESGGQGPSRA
jgi:hypothetical protein